jgi:hypothetical protein
MDLVVVFHPPQPGRRIQVDKLVSPGKDPPSGGRACASLHKKVCTRAPDHPPGAAYYAQTTCGWVVAPGSTMHFVELIALFFHQQGRHHQVGAGPAWLHRMPAHGGWGDTMVTSRGIIASAPCTTKKGISLVAWLEDVWLAHSLHGSSSIHMAP